MILDLEGMVNPIEVPRPLVYFYILSIILSAGALFVLRAIGLRTLAKRNGVKGGIWTVWVPFLWIYIACRIVSDMRLFGISFKTLAIVGLCLFSVYGLAFIIFNAIGYAPLALYYLQGGEIIVSSAAKETMEAAGYARYFYSDVIMYSNMISPTSSIYVAGSVAYPYNNMTLFTNICNECSKWMYYISIFKVLGTCFVYSAIFRKYWVEHFILGTLLSIFIDPMFSIFIFIIRKNPPARLIRVVRIDPDFNNVNNNAENPFKDFGEQKPKNNQDPGDPFADFWDKKD